MRQGNHTQSTHSAASTTHAYPLAVATVLVPVTDYRLLDADLPDDCPAIIQTECAEIRRKLAVAGGAGILVRSDDLGRGYRVTVIVPRFVLDPQAWAVETLGKGAHPIWGHIRTTAPFVPHHHNPDPLTAA